jgi:hypothetical protein
MEAHIEIVRQRLKKERVRYGGEIKEEKRLNERDRERFRKTLKKREEIEREKGSTE